MIPIKDHNPHDTVPYATYTLMAINTLVFVFMASLDEPSTTAFLHRFALIPSELFSTEKRGEWITLVSCVFLHAGLAHLIGNMLVLYVFGDNIEHAFGHIRYVLFYICAGMATSFASALFNADSTIPGLGASGAIMAVCGAYFMLYPKAEVTLWTMKFFMVIQFEIRAFVLILIWVCLDLIGAIYIDNSLGGTDYIAHLAGFAVGIALARILKQYDCAYDGYILPNGVWVQHKMPMTRRERMMQELGAKTIDYRIKKDQRMSDTDGSAWDKYER